MDTTKSSATPAHPSREPDELIEAHYSGLERLECFVCYEGLVFIGHHELTDEGEEIEVIEPVPCRRCAREAR